MGTSKLTDERRSNSLSSGSIQHTDYDLVKKIAVQGSPLDKAERTRKTEHRSTPQVVVSKENKRFEELFEQLEELKRQVGSIKKKEK